MSEVNVQYINPFLLAAKSIIKDICQIDLQLGKPYIKTTEFSNESVVIMIGITGKMRGQVMLGMPVATACTVASRMMMGMPVNDLDDMSISAISELGNMVMGNAATIFANNGIAIDITPPTLCRGSLSIRTSFAQNICVPMASADGMAIELNIAICDDK